MFSHLHDSIKRSNNLDVDRSEHFSYLRIVLKGYCTLSDIIGLINNALSIQFMASCTDYFIIGLFSVFEVAELLLNRNVHNTDADKSINWLSYFLVLNHSMLFITCYINHKINCYVSQL
jgi:hypothetical protein